MTLHFQGARRSHGNHLQEFPSRELWVVFFSGAHLGKKIKRIIACEAVGAEADIQAALKQRLHWKASMMQESMALRAMDHVQCAPSRVVKEFQIIAIQFVQVR